MDAQWDPYSDWSDWRSCSATCGGGERWHSRSRSCQSGRHGGIEHCEGPAEDVEKEACGTSACPPPVVQIKESKPSFFEQILGTIITGAVGQAFGDGGGVDVKISDTGTEAVFKPAPVPTKTKN